MNEKEKEQVPVPGGVCEAFRHLAKFFKRSQSQIARAIIRIQEDVAM